jgi:alkylation response protein AidB-like acyl-CoA dehydrogenase
MADTRISFVRSLCAGFIEQDAIFPYPTLEAGERETLTAVIEAIGQLLGERSEDFRAWDAAGEMPPEFIEELKAFGLFGLILPESVGGMDFGNVAYSRTLQTIASHDASVAVTIGAHSSIGMRGLKLFGTDAQKARYYDKLATGEMVAAFCLTEPSAGSDAASVRTTATDAGTHYVVNGSKIWITNGGFADFFTVFAKTGQADERAKLTALIITKDMPGVSVGHHEDKMGLRASSTTSVYFEDVKVPKDNVLGKPGDGFKIAMNILNSGRSGLGGGCVGAMKRCIRDSAAYALERKQFGKPIAEFGLIQQKIGHMIVECYAAESAVHMVAALSDQGYDDYSVEAAICKVYATEALWRTADEAVQVHGGTGYMREVPLERILRDSRINRIFEGTNDILRLYIGLTALSDVGQKLKRMSSLKGIFDDPIKGFGLLYDYARMHAYWRSRRVNVPNTDLSRVHLALQPEAGIFEELTRDLSAMADRLLRKHGKKIIDRQFAVRRMADVMIDLWVLACTLSRVTASIEREGEAAVPREIEIARVLTAQVRGRALRNFRKIDQNDDEAIKALAHHAFERGGYTWDVI